MSPRKKPGQPKPAQPKPVNGPLTYGDRQINEGTNLYAAFTRLSAMGERELAGAVTLLDAFSAVGQTAKRLGQMQAQLDRIEGRILEILRGPAARGIDVQAQAQPRVPADKTTEAAAPPPRPARPKKAAKPSHAARASVAKDLAELEETVEERQARMAKMEREEKRKNIAMMKKQEKLKTKKEKETAKETEEPVAEETATEAEKPAPKKKPRKRRKTSKKEDSAPAAETV